MKSRKIWWLIAILALVLFVLNYSYLDSQLKDYLNDRKRVNVTRVIDGDTIELNGSKDVRLLGVDTPERGEKFYDEASRFLENRIEGKKVTLEFGPEKKGSYGRILAYVKFKGENINLDLVREGYANPYFPGGRGMHYGDFVKAWKSCLSKGVRLCEKSDDVCSKCIELAKFDHENERVVFKNTCSKTCSLNGWRIEDEGGKKFVFENLVLDSGEKVAVVSGNGTYSGSGKLVEWREHDYVWTYTGDTLFLRDAEGDLVLWESY
ncbi:MAG: thermonuclease family protein [Candidatus Pacearchaeota archaeon]